MNILLRNVSRTLALLLLVSILINAITFFNWFIWKYENRKNRQSSVITYSNNKETIYQGLPISKDDIVFIGDSETQFYDVAEFFHTTKIKNRGIQADHTAGVLYRLPEILKGSPKKIFIQVGINDFGIKGISADSALINYSKILDRIKKDSPATKVYVESVLPTMAVSSDTIRKYNNGIRLLALENNTQFIDLYNPFKQGEKLSSKYDCGDGIHLNANGYFLWTKILTPYL